MLPILKQFHQSYPKVLFDLKITEQPMAIIDDSIDIAIRSGQLPDSNLIALPLTTTKLKLYASPETEHYLPSHPDQLNQFDWVTLSITDQTSALTLAHESGEQIKVQPKYQHYADSIASYCSLIEHNFGIGLMAEFTADTLVKKGKLIPVLPEWEYQTIPISLLYAERLHMAKRTRLLIDEIRSAFSCSD
ncbi:LysR substrate-binding domain-containing protein [Vibrio sinaloensis]|nr:LysR substrate-binding domain-containing protein [Vibrio sinaloensis]